MRTLQVDMATILEFRREKNLELYMTDLDGQWGEFLLQPEAGIQFRGKADMSTAEVSGAIPYVNKPIIYRDKRLTSYDWTSTDTWASSGEAKWIGAPDDGWKFLISSIQVRFPRSIKLTADNKLYFKVHLFYPPLNMVYPVINLEYSSVRELAKKSNNPLNPSPYAIEDLGTEELIEMEFVYADPYTLKGSPIVLHSCRNEFLEIGLTGNTPLHDTNDQHYDDGNETWCVIKGKQVYDF